MLKKLRLIPVAWISVGAILCVMPFLYNGVFFEQGHLVVDLVLLTLLLLASIYMLIRKFSSKSVSDGIGEQVSSKTGNFRFSKYDIAFSLFVSLYLIALMYAVNFTSAVQSALDVFALVGPYILLRTPGVRSQGTSWIVAGLAVASVILNIVGMANAWHQFSFPSAFNALSKGEVDSVFQYHNAYAAFESALAVGLLVFISFHRKGFLLNAIYSGVAGLCISGLIVSLSRGALALWLVVILLTLIGLRGGVTKHQLRTRFLLFFFASAIGTGIGYPFLHKGISIVNAGLGWFGIAITIIIPIGIVVGIGLALKSAFVQNLRSKLTLWPLVSICILCALFIAGLKSHALLQKLATYNLQQLSVAQRFIFWEDGLKIVARNPLTGSGGGAWPAMFQSVQTYPYYSTRVHSFVINTTMEVGILGLTSLLVAMWPMVRLVVWPRPTLDEMEQPKQTSENQMSYAAMRALVSVGFMLFIHAIMDWDMSFFYLKLIFIMSVGSAISLWTRDNSVFFPTSKSVPIRKRNIVTWLAPVSLVLSTVALFESIQMARAEYIAAQAATLPPSTTQQSLYQTAQRLVPYDASYLQDLANSSLNDNPATQNAQQAQQHTFQMALPYLQRAAALEPYDAGIEGQTATVAYHLGLYEMAYTYAITAFHDAPFISQNVSLAINAGTLYGLITASRDPGSAKQTFQLVHELYLEYKERLSVVQHLPSYLPPLQSYQLDPFTYDSLAATSLALGNPERAISFASNVQPNADVHTAQLAQLIILLSHKVLDQGVIDKDIQTFVSTHPSVKSSYHLLENVIQLND